MKAAHITFRRDGEFTVLKKRLFQLDDRLAACAFFVREGCKLADIGTDHGYLPIYLVKQGKIERAIAADINVGPLQKAAMHVRKYKAEDQVQTRLSNGLEVIFPNEVDDIVIAGMGGELIAQILDAAPWVKNPEKHLILQPMTAAEDLRAYLQENGFHVKGEQAAIADGKVYSAMLAVYDPDSKNEGELFQYVGLLDGSTSEGVAYIERQIRFFRNKAEGMRRGSNPDSAAPVEALVAKMEALIAQKEA